MKLNIENKKKFNLTYALTAAALFLLLQKFLAGYGATDMRIPYCCCLEMPEYPWIFCGGTRWRDRVFD